MFDCMEALGMGPRQLYDVTARGACMLRKASPFFAGLDPFAWSGTASIQSHALRRLGRSRGRSRLACLPSAPLASHWKPDRLNPIMAAVELCITVGLEHVWA
ncbi:hypothetical protein AALO_G00057250 [Alosa alosa]|uniref:Uncharacterized protein n=1 Tax=Alosa alosa TaxID=278164 RepID=A0AAV6H7I6_9TELE|nr:hypothetical protein AALO_G00057250 [Alosa alosa]